MEGQGGGSATPSYSKVVANRGKETGSNRFKKPMEVEMEEISTKNKKH